MISRIVPRLMENTSSPRPRYLRRWVKTAAAVGVVAIAITGCTSAPANQTGAAPTSIVFADLAPFTGVDAALGPIYMASCLAATSLINTAGGINGAKVSCKAADTRGDPADAVPAVRQLFATTPNLALIIGVTSDEASAVVPIINSNKMTMFSMTGEAVFSTTKYDYFYRLVAPDLAESYAMVAIAKQKSYKKIALAFGNDIGSQTFVQPAIDSIKKAGLSMVSNVTLDLSATTFRTEAAQIVAAHPDVILSEALGSAAGAFLSEVKQLNGGVMIPVIGTSASISPDWQKAVSAAIGANTLAANFTADNLIVDTSGAAYDTYATALKAQQGKAGVPGNFSTILTAPGAIHLYDGMNLAALAMVEAKSTTSSVYKPFMEAIGNGVPGAVDVTSFADGIAQLKKGNKIHYIGLGGPTVFDAFHNSTGLFVVQKYDAAGSVVTVGPLTTAELSAVTP